MQIDDSFLGRGVNEGFSGGEKKRNEILQMLVLEPTLALLDETDSGLDIDALKVVANGVNSLRSAERGIVLVTHYQRLLDHVVPDFVHVLARGRIVRSGDRTLAARARAARLRLGQRTGRRLSHERARDRLASDRARSRTARFPRRHWTARSRAPRRAWPNSAGPARVTSIGATRICAPSSNCKGFARQPVACLRQRPHGRLCARRWLCRPRRPDSSD